MTVLKNKDAISEESLIGYIQDYFKLSKYQAMVYLAVLKNDILEPPKIAEESGVPKPKTYEVVKDLLEHKKLIHQTPDGNYTPVDFAFIFDRVRKEREKQADNIWTGVMILKEEKKKLKYPKIFVKTGRVNIQDLWRQVQFSTNSEILICNDNSHNFRIPKNEQKELHQLHLEKNVQSKSILSEVFFKEIKDYMGINKKFLKRYRQRKGENFGEFMIADGEKLLVLLGDDEICHALYSEEKTLVDNYRALFNQLWVTSEEIKGG